MAKICTVFTVCGCVCVWRLSLFASACNDNDDDDALLLCALWGFHFHLPPPPPSNWIFSQEAQKWLLNRLISLSYIVKYTLFFVPFWWLFSIQKIRKFQIFMHRVLMPFPFWHDESYSFLLEITSHASSAISSNLILWNLILLMMFQCIRQRAKCISCRASD